MISIYKLDIIVHNLAVETQDTVMGVCSGRAPPNQWARSSTMCDISVPDVFFFLSKNVWKKNIIIKNNKKNCVHTTISSRVIDVPNWEVVHKAMLYSFPACLFGHMERSIFPVCGAVALSHTNVKSKEGFPRISWVGSAHWIIMPSMQCNGKWPLKLRHHKKNAHTNQKITQ